MRIMEELPDILRGSGDRQHKTRQGIGSIEIHPHPNKRPIVVVETDDDDSDNASPFFPSEVEHMFQDYPFGFRTPEHCSSTACRWIYPITFGGGLVGGDQIAATFVIGVKCSVLVCTQGMTKVYHCLDSDETRQRFDFSLRQNCLLCVLPDPLMCYKDARFDQKQTFRLCPSSNLVLLDWLHAGRIALGERWQFQRYCNTIEIFVSDKLVLRESHELESTPLEKLEDRMAKYELMGTCIILGPYLETLSRALQEKYGRKLGFGEENSNKLIVSVSPLSYCVNDEKIEGCYLRFLAADMKLASDVVRDITGPLLADLGGDPFERKLE